MRRAALVLAVGLVATLAACSAPAQEPQGGAECAVTGSGAASDGVTVSGELGEKPTVTIDSPVSVDATERTVITQGAGEIAGEGARVNVEFTLFNGTTGVEITTTGHAGQTVPFTLDGSLLPGLVKAIECSAVGSRLVAVMPPTDAYGENGADYGVNADDSVVFVIDLVSIAPPVLPRAEGEAQEPQAGLPTVELDSDGVPTVTIPDTKPPGELKLATLIKGTGETVGTGANVVVHYQGIIWDGGTVFNDSWAGGSPATFNTGNVVPGFRTALEGQTVGSQVLVVIPPELGYGPDGNPDVGIKGTDTLVFIIDILGLA